jgi:predicted HNH restriction endonuclease
MSKLIQDIEDSLIELVDEGYKVDVSYGTWLNPNHNGKNAQAKNILLVNIKTPYFSGEKIDKLEDYLHQCYDFMEMYSYKVFKVTINYSQVFNVKKIDKDKGKTVEGELKVNDWEELWDSIDFCLFSTPDKMYNNIKLEFKNDSKKV